MVACPFVVRVDFVDAGLGIKPVRQPALGVSAPAGCRKVGEVAVLEHECRVAACRVALKVAIQRRVEEVDIGDGTAALQFETAAEQLLLNREIGQMQVLGAINFLNRGVVADRLGRQALAVALGHGDVHARGIPAQHSVQVQIGAQEQLAGISRTPADSAGGVGRSLAGVVCRKGQPVAPGVLTGRRISRVCQACRQC